MPDSEQAKTLRDYSNVTNERKRSLARTRTERVRYEDVPQSRHHRGQFFLIECDYPLPLEIWGRLRRGITPEINAISSIIFVFHWSPS